MSDLVQVARELSDALSGLRFAPPVRYVYNPLEYAWGPHEAYLRRYGRGRREVVLVGMNPGPWGMAQTGVPFGEVGIAGDWLDLRADVAQPTSSHPKRPVTGFDCPRSEVSGRRLWGWAREAFGTPERFFETFFVANYCPLLFLETSGRNRTPDRLPVAERRALEARCDHALRRTIGLLEPRWVIGVGRFAERRAREALQGVEVSVGTVLHPSPASPAANRGWAAAASRQLGALGIPTQREDPGRG